MMKRNCFIKIRNVLVKENVETNFGFMRNYIILNGDANKFMDIIKVKGYKPKDNARRRAYVAKKVSSDFAGKMWDIYMNYGLDFEFDCKSKDGIDILVWCHELNGNYILTYDTYEANWDV